MDKKMRKTYCQERESMQELRKKNAAKYKEFKILANRIYNKIFI